MRIELSAIYLEYPARHSEFQVFYRQATGNIYTRDLVSFSRVKGIDTTGFLHKTTTANPFKSQQLVRIGYGQMAAPFLLKLLLPQSP